MCQSVYISKDSFASTGHANKLQAGIKSTRQCLWAQVGTLICCMCRTGCHIYRPIWTCDHTSSTSYTCYWWSI